MHEPIPYNKSLKIHQSQSLSLFLYTHTHKHKLLVQFLWGILVNTGPYMLSLPARSERGRRHAWKALAAISLDLESSQYLLCSSLQELLRKLSSTFWA
jgi:hypothetical protein